MLVEKDVLLKPVSAGGLCRKLRTGRDAGRVSALQAGAAVTFGHFMECFSISSSPPAWKTSLKT